VTNTIGAIFGIGTKKPGYCLFRDWNPNFLIIDTSNIPQQTKDFSLEASDDDTKSVTTSASIRLLKRDIASDYPLKLVDLPSYGNQYFQAIGRGSKSLYAYSDIKSGVDVSIQAKVLTQQTTEPRIGKYFTYETSRERQINTYEGISDRFSIGDAINIGSNTLIRATDKEVTWFYFRCVPNYFTNRDLNCNNSEAIAVNIDPESTIAQVSKTMDRFSVFFTQNSNKGYSKIFLDTGYGQLVTL
jgi:hypothetical protein